MQPDGDDDKNRRNADECNETYPEVKEAFEKMFVHNKTNNELRITKDERRITKDEKRITNYERRFMNHDLRTTIYEKPSLSFVYRLSSFVRIKEIRFDNCCSILITVVFKISNCSS